MNNKRNWLLGSLLAIAPNVSAEENATIDNVTPFIIGGSYANVNDFPYFASLYFDRVSDNGIYGNTCGASILDSQHVLTAAHCVMNGYYNLFTTIAIQVQEEANFTAVESVRASEFYIHPSYVNSSTAKYPNDIAIVKLERALTKVSQSDFVKLAALADEPSYQVDKTSMTIIGHGDTVDYGITQADEVSYLEQAPVRYVYNCLEPNRDKKICIDSVIFQLNGSDSYRSGCQGDSGGPLLWNDGSETKQVGITSYGASKCGDTQYGITGVYTEVADYTSWIDLVLQGNASPTNTYTEADRAVYRAQEASAAAGSLSMFGLISLALFGGFRRKQNN